MRDLLERLQTISQEQEDHEPELYEPENDVDRVTLSQEAVVFKNQSAIERILMEVHSIRKDMSSLKLQVERLKINNERYKTTVRRLTLLKKDSDAIARGIKQHARALFDRLQALNKECRRLEEINPHFTISRIARLQHDALMHDFRAAMSEYNKAEEMQRDACRERIKRQASIMGTEITNEQLDEMVEKGGEGWAELTQNLQTTRKRTLKRAIAEMKGRHRELVELEARMRDLHQLFQDMATLVEEQGSVINIIEANVCTSEEPVEEADVQIRRGIEYRKQNPFQQCCPCLPCWRCNQTV